MQAKSKAYKGLGMEGPVARWYTKITGKDLGEVRALAARIAGSIQPGSSVLEVAPGPGYLAIEIAKIGHFKVAGLDISHTFVDIARNNAVKAGVEIDFRQGDVAHMPFDDDAFQFLVCRAAFKNFSNPMQAIREMRRVLAPGGKALIIDLRKNASQASINAAVEQMGLGTVNSLLTQWTFRNMLLKRAYTADDFRKFIAAGGFDQFEIEETTIGFDIWLSK